MLWCELKHSYSKWRNIDDLPQKHTHDLLNYDANVDTLWLFPSHLFSEIFFFHLDTSIGSVIGISTVKEDVKLWLYFFLVKSEEYHFI